MKLEDIEKHVSKHEMKINDGHIWLTALKSGHVSQYDVNFLAIAIMYMPKLLAVAKLSKEYLRKTKLYQDSDSDSDGLFYSYRNAKDLLESALNDLEKL